MEEYGVGYSLMYNMTQCGHALGHRGDLKLPKTALWTPYALEIEIA